MSYTFIYEFSCVLPYSCLCSQLHLQEFSLLGEANLCASVLVTYKAVVSGLQGYDLLFGAFFTNNEISSN
jgi:hypothetical protein